MSQIIYQGRSDKYLCIILHYINQEYYNEDTSLALAHWLIEGKYNLSRRFSINEVNVLINNMKVYNINNKDITIYGQHYQLHSDIILITSEPSIINIVSNLFSDLPYNDIIPSNYTTTINSKSVSFNNIELCLSFCVNRNAVFRSSIVKKETNIDIGAREILKELTKISRQNDKKVLRIGATIKNAQAYLNDRLGYNYSPRNIKPNIQISIEDNYISALEDTKTKWVSLIDTNGVQNEIIRPKNILKQKIYSDYIGNTLVISDNKKSYYLLKEQLRNFLVDNHFHLIVINQYNITNINNSYNYYSSQSFLLFNSPIIGDRSNNKILFITIPNKKRLNSFENLYNEYYGDQYNFIHLKVKYNKDNTNKFINLEDAINYSYLYNENGYNHFIIPYDNNDDSIRNCFDLIQELYSPITLERSQYLIDIYINKYLLDNEVNTENDVLNVWFQKSTADATSEHQKLIQSYIDLKNKLLKNYQDMTAYLNNVNLTKKQPIPSLIFDKKSRKLFNKNKHNIYFQEKFYGDIDDIHLINPIQTEELYIRYILNKDNNNYRKSHTKKLKDLYDSKKNILSFKYEKLK